MAPIYGPSGAYLVDEDVLRQIGFTNHAIERFAQRAGLDSRRRGDVEATIRDLLLIEGQVVPELPRWARTRNEADLYLQIGEWMLLICRHSRHARGGFDVITVVNGPEGNDWDNALRRGFLFTPQPLRTVRPVKRRIGWMGTLAAALRERGNHNGEPLGLLARIPATHRGRKLQRDEELRRVIEQQEEAARLHHAAREAAPYSHLRRYGYIE
jgi:hypothetical protein